jgi:hypothetical protein
MKNLINDNDKICWQPSAGIDFKSISGNIKQYMKSFLTLLNIDFYLHDKGL